MTSWGIRGSCVLMLLGVSACAGLPRVDVTQEAARLLQTDRAFAQASLTTTTAAAFRQYLTEQAIHLPAAGAPVVGRQGIAQRLEGDLVLTWSPEHAEVARAGDLGWSWGRYELRSKSTGSVLAIGKYVDVWRKQPDGSWKVQVDIGNQAPPSSKP